MKTKIRDLGAVRDLLAEWEKVRQHIISGNVADFQAMFTDQAGQETIFLGGVYVHDREKALRSSLRMSMAKMLTEDDPPALKIKRC